VPQKRLDVLVEAAALLRRADVGVEVLIVGDGRLRDELSDQIERTGAPVRLLGERSDVGDLLVAADVFALSSAWEARSFAVQEAMRRGCAVVVPRVGGLPELVGNTGILVEAADAQALAAGVRQLVDDPDRRAELAAAAMTRALGWPDESTVIDETIAAYLECIRGSEM
jgi:glycosyltransferase involved in cell wall biosynthesis